LTGHIDDIYGLTILEFRSAGLFGVQECRSSGVQTIAGVQEFLECRNFYGVQEFRSSDDSRSAGVFGVQELFWGVQEFRRM